MKKSDVINFLLNSDLEGVEEVNYDEALVVKFYYDFDDVEIQGAEACASEETDHEKNSTEWIVEGVIPYLDDIAQDAVEEIIEDIVNEYDLAAEIVSRDMDPADYGYKGFLVAFSPEDEEINIDKILMDLNC